MLYLNILSSLFSTFSILSSTVFSFTLLLFLFFLPLFCTSFLK
nr:MAG TPA: hypothetical protein [Caudoviricetes sp.]